MYLVIYWVSYSQPFFLFQWKRKSNSKFVKKNAYDISHRQAKAYVGYRWFQTIMSLEILFCEVFSKSYLDHLLCQMNV